MKPAPFEVLDSFEVAWKKADPSFPGITREEHNALPAVAQSRNPKIRADEIEGEGE